LEPGAVLVLAGGRAEGSIRASQLGEVSLRYFRVEPERLNGLASLGEQRSLENAAGDQRMAARVLPPGHPVALKFVEASTNGRDGSFAARLRLLQLFVDAFETELKSPVPSRDHQPVDARMRLKRFLEQTPSSDLLQLSFEELVQQANCTPRHASRLFKEITGVTFREKQTELRLLRARELLASTDSKVVEVALESGYQSLSLFNLMFKRRFGMSPGKWRAQVKANRRAKRPMVGLESIAA
jgi:AraC-like DNA-binding protein